MDNNMAACLVQAISGLTQTIATAVSAATDAGDDEQARLRLNAAMQDRLKAADDVIVEAYRIADATRG